MDDLTAQIAAILQSDPICNGRVTVESVEAIASLAFCAGIEAAAKEAEAWFPGASANTERYPKYGVVAAIRAMGEREG